MLYINVFFDQRNSNSLINVTATNLTYGLQKYTSCDYSKTTGLRKNGLLKCFSQAVAVTGLRMYVDSFHNTRNSLISKQFLFLSQIGDPSLSVRKAPKNKEEIIIFPFFIASFLPFLNCESIRLISYHQERFHLKLVFVSLFFMLDLS